MRSDAMRQHQVFTIKPARHVKYSRFIYQKRLKFNRHDRNRFKKSSFQKKYKNRLVNHGPPSTSKLHKKYKLHQRKFDFTDFLFKKGCSGSGTRTSGIICSICVAFKFGIMNHESSGACNYIITRSCRKCWHSKATWPWMATMTPYLYRVYTNSISQKFYSV